jgi:hypothetical protein
MKISESDRQIVIGALDSLGVALADDDHEWTSPPVVMSVKRNPIKGNPVIDLISTSHVEKQNHTLRMHCRRLTRLTNAFSKKLENFKAAVALHYAYYNFVKPTSRFAVRQQWRLA